MLSRSLAAGLRRRPPRRQHQNANKPFAKHPPLRPPLPVLFVGHVRYLLRSKPPPECRSKSAPWNTLCQHHPDPWKTAHPMAAVSVASFC